MAKSTKIIAALSVAGALGVAALPMASYAADITTVVDKINVQVKDMCSFVLTDAEKHPAVTHVATQDDVDAGKASAIGETVTDEEAWNGNAYTGTAFNGEAVDFDNTTDGQQDQEHEFTVRCNNNKGYNVKAKATGLTSGLTGDHNTISFATPAAYATALTGIASQEDGKWTATVSGTAATGYTISDAVAAPSASDPAEIVKKDAATDSQGVKFKVTYKAFVGQSTQAGTYSGDVTYTLAANPAS